MRSVHLKSTERQCHRVNDSRQAQGKKAAVVIIIVHSVCISYELVCATVSLLQQQREYSHALPLSEYIQYSCEACYTAS